jgi:hypothetical protein
MEPVNNADKILFRCSSLGYIMTDPKSKSELLSETTKAHLCDKYVSAKYNRETDITNKYIRKGLMVEEDAITLYSLYKKDFFKKNELTLDNGLISGTPDLFTGDIIHDAKSIIDIKSSWDIFTYYRNFREKLNKMYYWQIQGYMALTGAQNGAIAYCLVDTPQPLLFEEMNRLKWKMGVLSEETDETFKQACEEMERLAKYDDIPLEEKVIEIPVARNDADIERIYERVKQCRVWMNDNLFKTNGTQSVA